MSHGTSAPVVVAAQQVAARLPRVLGWDFLRGLCALSVCSYHLLIWLDVAALYTFGLYGVYLFFVLSGASLAYTYGEKISRAGFSFADFLLNRYFRLAPLYGVLLVLVLPWKLGHEPLSMALLGRVLANLFLVFGVYHPATQSLLVGGWSLGIEVVFYLLFPLMMGSLRLPHRGWIVGLGLLGLQAAWILSTAGSASGYDANLVAYHHAPAFAAYFFAGCVIGNLRRSRGSTTRLPMWRGIAVIVCGFALMLALNADDAARVLTGWRGIVLTALSFALVLGAGDLAIQGERMSALALRLGNATYGLYLLHPVLFFGLVLVALPKLGYAAPQHWALGARLALAVGVAAGSFALALASERRLEQPLRQWLRSLLARRVVLRSA